MIVLDFLNRQLLKMEWLYNLVENLVVDVFGLDMESRVGGSLHFYLYDVVKIFILLSVLIFTISYVQSFFPPERTKRILGRYKGIGANTLAAL
ncbi:MAG: permease, partial [Clostridia bacterium]|nr:permease [Clostridia bacterium]